MEWLSEDCWCAGWYDGLEFDLWAARDRGGPFRYGARLVATIEIDVLQWLYAAANGWVMWADDAGPVFVDLVAWKAIYDQGKLGRS